MDGLDALAAAIAEHGWAVTPGLVPAALCAEARMAFTAEVAPCDDPLPRQHSAAPEPHRRSAEGWVLNPVINPHRMDRFPRFQAIPRAFLDGSPLPACAEAALGGPPALLQAAYYESADGTAPHRDEHPVDPDAPMVGAWIALEPIAAESGPFVVWPGTHRIAEPELVRASRASWEARFVAGVPDGALDAAMAALLRPHLERTPGRAPTLGAGDVLWWRRDLVHGSLRPAGRTRHSLVLHFVLR